MIKASHGRAKASPVNGSIQLGMNKEKMKEEAKIAKLFSFLFFF